VYALIMVILAVICSVGQVSDLGCIYRGSNSVWVTRFFGGTNIREHVGSESLPTRIGFNLRLVRSTN
jgi:hypothetical protein